LTTQEAKRRRPSNVDGDLAFALTVELPSDGSTSLPFNRRRINLASPPLTTIALVIHIGHSLNRGNFLEDRSYFTDLVTGLESSGALKRS
jgi:hypothetical protein